ncbi:MAG: hypothetical protein ABF760_04890 [Zymomonas mobilis]|uniref:Uncharacterized protein n=1 Tax=Zymomonas mobilis TaxID=542 RepID=A0A542W197_ZYMMB|nr:hypothetical protein [Zymomonas mobilis]TQL17348.1 hypothetical protein FBY58_0923 [Zymomonas mobilis]
MRNSEKAFTSKNALPSNTQKNAEAALFQQPENRFEYGVTAKKQKLSHQKIESSAANYLRRKGYVPVCHANIVDMTFSRDVWLVGQHVVSTEDMLEMASMHGFQTGSIQ